ncbi:MAG: 2OG-Fe(II) oxygenase [Simkaniaceae bacterium]|nr:2OG-Fe(II) oxygenase [Simkaniaceae bacterium]
MNPVARSMFHTLPLRTIYTTNRVISGSKLTESMLSDVIKGQALACHVEDFIPKDECRLLTSRLIRKLPYEYYEYAEGSVGRIGFSFSEAGTPETRKRYYEEALPSIEAIRKACGDLGSPIDKFRLTLQDVWSYGANLEMLDEGKKMFVGLCRMIEADKNILPHQDMIRWYDKASPRSQEIISQLTMNIYLQIPKMGGELELWDWGFRDKEEYEKHAEGSYGIDKAKLDPPALIIQPKIGDLVLFNPEKLHCITTGSGQRFSVSCFIGYRGDKKPLTYWS